MLATMRWRGLLFWIGIAIAVALGVRLRLYTKAQVTQGQTVRALGSDDNYHLRRARFAVAHYPRTIRFDPPLNFPPGADPLCPPLYDVALATPARLLEGPGATAAAVERHAAWVPLVFAAG